MESSRPRLSVIVPTYNESKNITLLLEKLGSALRNATHEIIVVDDNSPDLTWEIAEKFKATHPNIRVIRRLGERGLSSAVLTGMAVAGGNVLAVMDADLQHDETILMDMLHAVESEGYDAAVGSRATSGGSYGQWSKIRKLMSWSAALLAKIMLPVSVKDPMSGFFAISRALYTKSADRINPRGFKILLEFIARQKPLKIKEIGYTFRTRIHGETKLSSAVIRNYFVALYDLRFGQYISPTFILYAAVGSPGVLVNILVFQLVERLSLPHIYTGISPALDPVRISAVAGIQTSILSNYILNNNLTFHERRYRGASNIKGFVLFELISFVGLVVQYSVIQLLSANGFLYLAGTLARKIVYTGTGLGIATITNYYLNLNFTWQKKGAERS